MLRAMASSRQSYVRVSALLLSIAATAWPTIASVPTQGAGSRTYKIVRFSVVGSERYDEETIRRATALPLRRDVTEAELKTAAQKLGESGAFDQVEYEFAPATGGVVITFRLLDFSGRMLPVTFRNFLWFTSEELSKELNQRVPLFNGAIPESGTLKEDVRVALAKLLEERGARGEVRAVDVAKLNEGPHAVTYQVAGLDLPLATVEFTGNNGLSSTELARQVQDLIGKPYDEATLLDALEHRVKPLYLSRGYLGASASPTRVRLTRSDGREAVETVVAVTEGITYRLSAIRWKGNTAFADEELNDKVKPPINEVVNGVKLANDIRSLTRDFASRGFIMAELDVKPQLFPNGSVLYEVEIEEGDRYTMGELTLMGLDTRTAERLRRSFRMPKGDVYNAEYPKKFAFEAMQALLAAEKEQYQYSVMEKPRDPKHEVDVTILFKKR